MRHSCHLQERILFILTVNIVCMCMCVCVCVCVCMSVHVSACACVCVCVQTFPDGFLYAPKSNHVNFT